MCIRDREIGFRVIQFNAVVKSNTTALKLYQKLGFTQLGTIPGGFLNKDSVYAVSYTHLIAFKKNRFGV